MNLAQWAQRWNIPAGALIELRQAWGMDGTYSASPGRNVTGPEAVVQNAVRLEAAEKGVMLWRNNVGALRDDTGRVVRYGLANDSKNLNDKIKSGDMIGVRPRVITVADVGKTIGQFVSRECKPSDWSYADTPRERAQFRWIELVTQAGGDACFVTGKGSL